MSLGAHRYMSELWRNKNVARFLSETRLWDYRQSRSILHAIHPLQTNEPLGLGHGTNQLLVLLKSGCARRSTFHTSSTTQVALGADGIPALQGKYGANSMNPYFSRSISSKASEQPRRRGSEKPPGQTGSETKKDISTVEDPFDAPTYNIPQKPVTFVEGASYTAIILVGLGIAAAAGYAVFKELIFQPKEYKVFNKALKRIQDDSQAMVRKVEIVLLANVRITIWTDEDGVEHVEVNFYIRGPHGAGKVYSEMFKDQVDKQWKYTYLIVEIKSPAASQLILESYMPSYNPDTK
ncbi:putative mitochondrial import inner membrane translocase subunit TIM21 [Morella rubra]|uniref:Mitochondrial import inner membrane translocase subunit Tim21 n=1 Tax=Morella rubra TaxID=262757 RepID=A0A6A1V7K1_9ROSI|nr:putative mitochondrial import inner membrane translocase subunit TIM21 [Morella rubra]